MKISIITAVYNRESTIGQAARSVWNQDYPNVEHIVQDAQSTDGTLAVIKQESPKSQVFSEADTGIYDAINRGIDKATGDVIGLMHSDDFFADNQVLSRVANILSNPEVDGVYGDLEYVSAADTSNVVRKWVSGKFEQKMLKNGWMPPHPTLYLRKNVFEEYGVYDTKYKIAADYDAMLRYIKAGINLEYDPNTNVKMRVGGVSNASLKTILNKSLEDYRALSENKVGGIPTLVKKNMCKLTQFF